MAPRSTGKRTSGARKAVRPEDIRPPTRATVDEGVEFVPISEAAGEEGQPQEAYEGEFAEEEALAQAVEELPEHKPEGVEPGPGKSNKKKGKKGKDDSKSSGAAEGEQEGGEPNDGEPKVLYIGHIPHGFYETQMRLFFSQFGDISRLRLSRNKKTGRSKHYAFIEFCEPEVARIVADAMHGYMLFGQLLQVKLVPQQKVHPKTFVGANKKFKIVPWKKLDRARHNKDLTLEEEKARIEKLAKRDTKRQRKLAEAGIDYTYEGYRQKLRKRQSAHTRFDAED